MNDQSHLIETLRHIQIQWELTTPQLSAIAHVSESVLSQYLSLPAGELESLPPVPSALVDAVPLAGLYRRLVGVYPAPEAQNEWLKRPNSVFEGHRPIDVMAMSPEHLAFVAYAVESGLTLTASDP